MSDSITQTAESKNDREGTAKYLVPCVIALQALQVNGKQAHWHIRGENFIAVHQLLDSVVQHARAYADLAAERTVALGVGFDARIGTVAERNSLPAMRDGFQNWKPMIAEVVSAMDETIRIVRDAVTGLDDIDLRSQDVVIGIERGLVEDRWFLAAHLAED